MSCFTTQMATTARSGPGQSQELRGLPGVHRDSVAWAILGCFPKCFNKELDQEWRNWDLVLIPRRDAAVTGGGLTPLHLSSHVALPASPVPGLPCAPLPTPFSSSACLGFLSCSQFVLSLFPFSLHRVVGVGAGWAA